MITMALLAMPAVEALDQNCQPDLPRGYVARSVESVVVIAPSDKDAEIAAHSGRIAAEASRRFLGINLSRLWIVPKSASVKEGCGFVFRWEYPVTGSGTRLPTHVLPHEIGHQVFIRFLAPLRGVDEYGGSAPDWLDEMSAMAFEDEAGVMGRRRDASRLAGRHDLIPISRLLTMAHPEWRPGPVTSGVGVPGSGETPAFYATVRALFDFLIARTGNEKVIRTLAMESRRGISLDGWLLSHVARDRRLGLAGLDAELATFVMSNPAYRAVPAENPK